LCRGVHFRSPKWLVPKVKGSALKTIFAVFAVDNPDALGQAIQRKYPNDHLLVAPGQWLIATEGTAQSVAEHLGISGKTDATISPALVVSVSGYFGRKAPSVWEWIKAKWGST
jgi:hypothetical protein